MNPFDIIPDTHGQSAKLDAALAGLGWKRSALGWTHLDPDRQIVFLGDFIDRGPDNRTVLKTVRELVDAGKAKAIMGNHELNALHFHTMHPDDGQPLRAHSPKNIRQHRTFLDQFPPGDPQTRDVLDWMRSLPLFFEEDGFRAVHACWIDASLDRLKTLTGDGVLTEEQLIRAADRDEADEMFILAEQITKGPEQRLPEGWSFTDTDGTERDHVRLQWWNAAARTWRDIAISVPSVGGMGCEPTQAIRHFTLASRATRLPRVLAMLPSMSFGTHVWVLAEFAGRPLKSNAKSGPNRNGRGSPKLRLMAILSPASA